MPGRGIYAGALVSYDLINQKYRTLANITTFNNSSKPTIELVDYIFDYEKVRIEMDGIMIFMDCWPGNVLDRYPSSLCMCRVWMAEISQEVHVASSWTIHFHTLDLIGSRLWISYGFVLCLCTIWGRSVHPSSKKLSQWLFLLQEIFYQINLDNKTCQESSLSGSLPPIEVPATASYIAQLWIGVEGQLGAGLETELWMGTPSGM